MNQQEELQRLMIFFISTIEKMIRLLDKYRSIDRYYQVFIELDSSMKLLVRNFPVLPVKTNMCRWASH